MYPVSLSSLLGSPSESEVFSLSSLSENRCFVVLDRLELSNVHIADHVAIVECINVAGFELFGYRM